MATATVAAANALTGQSLLSQMDECDDFVPVRRAMTTATVTVTNAVTGQILLNQIDVECNAFVPVLRAKLGHRPSRPVTLILDGHPVTEGFCPEPGASLQLSAVLGQALSEEQRAEFIATLAASQAYMSKHVFSRFPEAARDDKEIVLAAMKKDVRCVGQAGSACREDRDIVLELVKDNPWILRRAGPACCDDKEIVLEAVKVDPWILQHASQACREDRDIVLEAIHQDPWCLEHAGPALRDDRKIVLETVKRNPQCLRFAGPACRDDREIVLAAMKINPECLRFAGEACRADLALQAMRNFSDGLKHVGLTWRCMPSSLQ